LRYDKKEWIWIKKITAVFLFVAAGIILGNNQQALVSAAMDKDDFETVEEWEAYQKKSAESQSTEQSSGISTRMALSSDLGEAISRIPTTHVEATAQLRYVITGLPITRAIQKTFIEDGYIYVTQRMDSDIYLSRCKIGEDRKTAVCQDWMLLQDFGHGQTLEAYQYNDKLYFWTTCRTNTSYSQRWSLEIGRIEYQAGKTISSYKNVYRFTGLAYANEDQISFGTLKRSDAALSEDGEKLIIWAQNTSNQMQYSIYDAVALNQLLDTQESTSSKSLSFKTSTALKAACQGTLWQLTDEEKTLPNGSFQGICLTSDSSICVVGGGVGETPALSLLTQVDGSYTFSSLITITNSNFNETTEIEGVQLEGNEIYFGICDHNTKTTEQYIYSISRRYLNRWASGHTNITIRNEKAATCSKTGYTGDVYCEDCSRTLASGVEIAKIAHTYGAGVVTKKPTAVKKGTKTYTCTVCGAKKTESIKATGAPAKGKLLTSGKVTYKVTKSGKKNGTVQFVKTKSTASTIVIPSTVSISGITYKVTSIAANALKNNKKVTKVTVGKNVTTIGKYAFYGCSKLKSITLSTVKLSTKTVGTKAFSGVYAKVKVKVPKSKKKTYLTLLRKKGMSTKASVS
jgi:hypothetical protein